MPCYYPPGSYSDAQCEREAQYIVKQQKEKIQQLEKMLCQVCMKACIGHDLFSDFPLNIQKWFRGHYKEDLAEKIKIEEMGSDIKLQIQKYKRSDLKIIENKLKEI